MLLFDLLLFFLLLGAASKSGPIIRLAIANKAVSLNLRDGVFIWFVGVGVAKGFKDVGKRNQCLLTS